MSDDPGQVKGTILQLSTGVCESAGYLGNLAPFEVACPPLFRFELINQAINLLLCEYLIFLRLVHVGLLPVRY